MGDGKKTNPRNVNKSIKMREQISRSVLDFIFGSNEFKYDSGASEKHLIFVFFWYFFDF